MLLTLYEFVHILKYRSRRAKIDRGRTDAPGAGRTKCCIGSVLKNINNYFFNFRTMLLQSKLVADLLLQNDTIFTYLCE